MINGLNISEIRAVNLTHSHHSKKLQDILLKSHSNISQLDKQLTKVVHNKKYNHQRWRKFKQHQKTTDLNRDNSTYRSKITQIKMDTSIYRYQNDASFINSVAHSFYNRKKLETKFSQQNKDLAKRIIEIQPSIKTSKANLEYGKMHSIMKRLEKFPLIQRLSSFTQRKRIKTEFDSPKDSRIEVRYNSVPKKRISHLQL